MWGDFSLEEWPETLLSRVAYKLDPELVRDAALLGRAAAPDDRPSAPVCLSAEFLCQACFANACLPEQQQTRGTRRLTSGESKGNVFGTRRLALLFDLQK